MQTSVRELALISRVSLPDSRAYGKPFLAPTTQKYQVCIAISYRTKPATQKAPNPKSQIPNKFK
jgi:hypothetical protein